MNKLFDVLYHDERFLVVQSLSGKFDDHALYGEHNMALHVNDEPDRVLNNRAKLLNALNDLTDNKVNSIHWVNQVHGNDVVDANHALVLQNADALVSDERGVGLAIMTADCVPVVLFGGDKKSNPKIACIHAGWQGLVKGVIKKAFDKLDKPNGMNAIIAGCISQQNYEIDNELAHKIVSQVIDGGLVALTYDELYHKIIEQKNDKKCHLDIVKLTQLQLDRLGINVLSQAVACSYANPNLYSYREQTHTKKTATGRMATVVVGL